MAFTIPTIEPWDLPVGDARRRVRQGVTLSWYKTLSDYPPATWTLTYQFASATARYTVTATNNGDGRFLCTAAATTTDDWAAGTYSVLGYVTSGAEVYEVYRGHLEVLIGLQLSGNASGADDRSSARKIRDAILALLEGRATDDQMAMSISSPDGHSRSINRMTRAELQQSLDRWQYAVKAEEDAERIDRGLGARNKIRVRFTQ